MLTLLTIVVTIFGATIAYFQWRTAHQKVALDILEKRFTIYNELRTIVAEFQKHADFSLEDQRIYADAQRRARFIFGADVDRYLGSVRSDLMRGHFFEHQAGQTGSQEHEQDARMARLDSFYAKLDRMFVPYMRIDQKMPLWWRTDFLLKVKDVFNSVTKTPAPNKDDLASPLISSSNSPPTVPAPSSSDKQSPRVGA
jgi:hypothetical protein